MPHTHLEDAEMHSGELFPRAVIHLRRDGEFLKTSCGSPNYASPEVVSGKAGAWVSLAASCQLPAASHASSDYHIRSYSDRHVCKCLRIRCKVVHALEGIRRPRGGCVVTLASALHPKSFVIFDVLWCQVRRGSSLRAALWISSI